MAVDVTEYWLQVIAGKLDRLIQLGENVERASRSQEMPEEWGEHEGDHFVGAGKMVADEPVTEPEHPAGVVPDQGEGCCEPTEKGIGGDIEVIATASWIHGRRDRLTPAEPPKPPEPEYREPVLPADCGKWAEFSHDGINWMRYKLRGCHKDSEASLTIWSEEHIGFRHCRIKKES